MRAIALRIASFPNTKRSVTDELQELLAETGQGAWIGSRGKPVAQKSVNDLMSEPAPTILLVNRSTRAKHWATVSRVQYETPDTEVFPDSVEKDIDEFHTWFLITDIRPAPSNILARCRVVSSGLPLGSYWMKATSPYYIVDILEDVNPIFF